MECKENDAVRHNQGGAKNGDGAVVLLDLPAELRELKHGVTHGVCGGVNDIEAKQADEELRLVRREGEDVGNRHAQGVDNQADHEAGNEVQCEVCAFLTALDAVRVDSESPDGLRNGIDEREATTDHDGVDANGVIKDVIHAVRQADEHEAQ